MKKTEYIESAHLQLIEYKKAIRGEDNLVILECLESLKQITPNIHIPTLIEICLREAFLVEDGSFVTELVAKFFGLEAEIEVPVRITYTRLVREEATYLSTAKIYFPQIQLEPSSPHNMKLVLPPDDCYSVSEDNRVFVKSSHIGPDPVDDPDASMVVEFASKDLEFSHRILRKIPKPFIQEIDTEPNQ